MALEVKLGQELRLRQQLVMTPQLQQAIKILQLSLPDLEALVEGELEQNPMLEMVTPELTEEGPADQGTAQAAESAETAGPDDGADFEPQEQESAAPTPAEPAEAAEPTAESADLGTNPDELEWRQYFEDYANNWQDAARETNDEGYSALENSASSRSSLEAHLMWQLRLSSLSREDQVIGAAIIYNLNEGGYLDADPATLETELKIDPVRFEKVLKRVQRFDPPGVAARDLRECLLVQLAVLGMEDSLAARIVREHLGLLEKRRGAEIARRLGVSAELVTHAAKVISLLEPKPGRSFSGELPAYVVPDIQIQKLGNDYVVTLNDAAMPRLRLAGYYQRLMSNGAVGSETRDYLQERLRAARWLVKSIYQRQHTILKVGTSIVKFQRAFFDHGVKALRPLVLRDVAEDVGMHESTVSRATTNKYAATPQGLFELKFFFTSGVRSESGDEVSAETIKDRIRALVEGEGEGKPLSDQEIVERLRVETIKIARRTVAKYRQALGILPSARRRRLD
ncbi:MAG: RNA polymerase factor sigma-54 [Deltaproteobacteria bacterium]|jgi:RNA polymerase sigma-54 factor|nr:RNA polymerase factor sigma-54 [Deltaproteobacteria bacterium]